MMQAPFVFGILDPGSNTYPRRQTQNRSRYRLIALHGLFLPTPGKGGEVRCGRSPSFYTPFASKLLRGSRALDWWDEWKGKKGRQLEYPRAWFLGSLSLLLVPVSPLPPSGEKRRITTPLHALVAYFYNFNVEVKSYVRKCLIPLLFSLAVVTLSSPLPASFSATGGPSILFLLYELDLTGRIRSASPLCLPASYASKAKTRPVLGYPSHTLEEHQPPLQTQAENYIASYDSQHCNPRRRVASTIGQDHLRHPRRCAM